MDPKQSNKPLDPKLQEVYDRVMGTSTNPSDPAHAAPQPHADTPAVTPPPADPGGVQMPSMPTTPSPVTPPISNPLDTPATPVVPIEPPAATPPAPAEAPEPASPAEANTPVSMETTQPIAAAIPSAPSQPDLVQVTHISTHSDKKTKVSPVILILGAVVFLVAYALIWIKVFGLQLPFLPQ